MQPEIIPLTDDELLSVADDPELVPKLTSEERRRLTRLRPQAAMPIEQTATGAFFGSHRPINESGQPLEAGFLDRYVNPGLERAAHPESMTDMVNLLIPGQIPNLGMVGDAVGAVAGGIGRVAKKGAAMVGDLASPEVVGMVSPRLGNALRFAQNIRERLKTQAAPATTPKPPRAGSLEEFMSASPERRAEIKAAREEYFGRGVSPKPSASATPPAAPSAAPQAAAAPAPSRSTPRPPASESLRLTPDEHQALEALVAEGHDPADVIQAIAQQRQAAQPSVAPKASGKPTLNAAETKEYQRLLTRGKTPEQAMTIIEQQRAFVQSKGLPSAEEARRAVVDRNETGRWRD